MISIDEIKSTIKRLDLLKNNSENPSEQYTSILLIQELNKLVNFMEQQVENPDFENVAKEIMEQIKNKE